MDSVNYIGMVMRSFVVFASDDDIGGWSTVPKSCHTLYARYSSRSSLQYLFDFSVQLASDLQRGGICIGS